MLNIQSEMPLSALTLHPNDRENVTRKFIPFLNKVELLTGENLLEEISEEVISSLMVSHLDELIKEEKKLSDLVVDIYKLNVCSEYTNAMKFLAKAKKIVSEFEIRANEIELYLKKNFSQHLRDKMSFSEFLPRYEKAVSRNNSLDSISLVDEEKLFASLRDGTMTQPGELDEVIQGSVILIEQLKKISPELYETLSQRALAKILSKNFGIKIKNRNKLSIKIRPNDDLADIFDLKKNELVILELSTEELPFSLDSQYPEVGGDLYIREMPFLKYKVSEPFTLTATENIIEEIPYENGQVQVMVRIYVGYLRATLNI